MLYLVLGLLLLVPILVPIIAHLVWHKSDNQRWSDLGITRTEMIWQLCAGVLVVVIPFIFIVVGNAHDTQILNGEVLAKKRDHGSYIRSYPCNCRTGRTGKSTTTTCQTCFEDHYTVTWWTQTTVGNITLGHEDRTSRSVYKLPDPPQYVNCKIGEYAGVESGYKNYIKAVPKSLFNTNLPDNIYPIPEYPKIHDYYKINRVIGIQTTVDTVKLNDKLNDVLKKLGKQKEVNVVVIITGIKDSSYGKYIENKWIGGKKNDVVIVMGVNSDDKRIEWTYVYTWANSIDNELFTVKLRDNLNHLGYTRDENNTAWQDKFSDVVAMDIKQYFHRTSDTQFDYLANEITPSDTACLILFLISVLVSIGMTYYFYHNNDLEN